MMYGIQDIIKIKTSILEVFKKFIDLDQYPENF